MSVLKLTSSASRSRDTTKKILSSKQGKKVDEGAPTHHPSASVPTAQSLTALFCGPPAEREYLLEYYALVHAGKTNYVSKTAILAFFGHRGQEPTKSFKVYSVRAHALCLHPECLSPTSVQAEFKPKKPRTTKTGGAESAPKSVPTRASGRGEGAAPGVKSACHDDVEM